MEAPDRLSPWWKHSVILTVVAGFTILIWLAAKTYQGAPYTGQKPARRDLGRAIPAADEALENRSVEPLLKFVGEKTREGILEHFKEASGKADFDKNDLDAGREYVKAYVDFVHYVERLYEEAPNPVHGHFQESDEASMHEAEN